jgi:hypothetical protein
LDAELQRWKESRIEVQDSATAYLRQWIALGWLREQDDVLLSTAACDTALRFAKGLDREERGTTASHLRIVQDAVRDLAIAMTSDPGQRIRALEKQRQALEREIEDLHAGVVVEISSAEQHERLREIYQLASVLTGDFRRLEDEIRQMDHALRVQMIQGDSTRGDVLMALLKKEGALADTDAGRAFEGFFQLLADDGRTTELREQLRAILESLASRQLNPDERQFLSRLESSEFRENRAVARILAELERRAVELRDAGIAASARTRLALASGRAELSSVETIRLRLPDESLQLGPIEKDPGTRALSDAMLEHLETVKVLEVAADVFRLVTMHGPMTLGEVIEKRPLTAGIEELVAHVRIAQAVNAPRDESTESLTILGQDGARLRATIPTYVLTPELLPAQIEDLAL